MAPSSRPSESSVLDAALQKVQAALPPAWGFEAPQPNDPPGADLILRIISPAGEAVTFAVEAKSSGTPLVVQGAVSQALRSAAAAEARPLVIAPFLGDRAKRLISSQDVSYADTTGNLWLVADKPGLLIERTGATKDPWPDDVPLRTLRGRGAARATRALVDFKPPFGVRELAERATVPAATLSRVIDLLARDALVARRRDGKIGEVNWPGVLERWARDYDVRRTNHARHYLEPRGLPSIISKLSSLKDGYAATGALAAQTFAPVAPARLAMFYVPNPSRSARDLDLREVPEGANVILLEPFDQVVFERTLTRDGLRAVAPSQLAVDLLSGAGREPAEGVSMLDWMQSNEPVWRR